ncbi:hypothetical protein N473_12940 [Pseudoalteromonas luteoviolacea CPMOR-1]|uniref:Uncharacterized protein n=1 Tax=Pseudoalteromonas luteoviolacea CPMOR-1 TaxID=1365248 RepID=A0A167LNW2_9GAMM|nr:hypothetical protein [Pseudoalteromonas luteoviolacea]KZN64938.1 hypothetical protein N473_12940 [Pseudoalteromonas luteoviolacea CPMOR-1]
MINTFEYQLLAGAAMGLTEEQTENLIDQGADFDDELIKALGIDFEQFVNVSQALLKLTPAVEGADSNKLYNAFVRPLESGGYLALIQKEI